MRPEIVPVAGVKEVEVRLADVDVVHGRVGVQLLVPLRDERVLDCLLYTSPSPRDRTRSRMPSSA